LHPTHRMCVDQDVRLLVAVLALLAVAPAAQASAPVAWEDPCGDAARSATVAGQRATAPGREGLDLRGASVLAEAAAITLTLRTCAPLDDSPEGTFVLTATLPDGCLLRLDRADQVQIAGAEPVEVRRRTLIARDCEVTTPFNPSDASAELPDEAVDVAADALVVRIPRDALGPALAPGTVLRDVVASTSEVGPLAPTATLGGTVLVQARPAQDRAPGPPALPL
jgi:hypothetical protein